MNILYYCNEYFSNYGARTHAREFFRALYKSSQVTHAEVYPQNQSSKQLTDNDKKGRLYFLPKRWRTFVHFFTPRKKLTKKLVLKLSDSHFDCIIVRPRSYIDYRLIKKRFPNLILALEINGLKYDEFFHDITFGRFLRSQEMRVYQHADCIFVVSSILKDALVNAGFSDDKILVNPNGVNINHFRDRETFDRGEIRRENFIPEHAFVLGYVGGMEPFKRLPEVIDIFAKLRREGEKDFFLFIAGDGSDRRIVQDRIKHNRDAVSGWISFLGWQPYRKIPELMSVFDVAIFPYTNPYCSPLKLFEYLAMGIPTVGPDVSGVRDVFQPGEHIALASQDGSNFRDIILEFKTDADYRMKLGKQGQRYVTRNFTWNRNVERVCEHVSKFRVKATRSGEGS
jgi:glycosyltransferase involved in cell wall biosynthesis